MKRTWLEVTVDGLNLERLIQRIGERNIPLRRMRRPAARRMTALVPEDRLSELQAITLDGGWQFVTGRKHGAGHWSDVLVRHWGLTVGVMTVLFGAMLASQGMWHVEVLNAGPYLADIHTCLREQGISVPMWKRQVDLDEVRDALIWRYPTIARIDCGWRGMTLCISVNEGIAQGETVSAADSGNVIASRDGVVDSVITYAGTARVRSGETVRKGQLLIAGEERSGAEEMRTVRAEGVVMARVWDGARVRVSTTEVDTVYTGRVQHLQQVVTPLFDLWQTPDAPYESMDVHTQTLPLGGLFWPLILINTERYEATAVRHERPLDAVKAEAALAAMRKLRQKVGVDSEILDKWVEYSMIDDGELQAVAVCERIVDIAQAASADASAGLPRARGQ